MEEFRKCCRCGEVKPIENFYRRVSKARKERLKTCKPCHDNRRKKKYEEKGDIDHDKLYGWNGDDAIFC